MEFKENMPIYLQVAEDIRNKIICGELGVGERLMSSRTMAKEYNINPNTAARVYTELETQGLVGTRRGVGTFVTQDEALVKKIMQERMIEVIDKFFLDMEELGYTTDKVIDIIKSLGNAPE